MATKVALLSHRGGNIGHDFMAIGMEAIAKVAFGSDTQLTHFEQHHPFSVYPQHHWLRLINYVPHGSLKPLRKLLNRPQVRQLLSAQTIDFDFDLAVACGGPNVVPEQNISPELGLLLHHMNGAFKSKLIPLLDAGVGAAFPLENFPRTLTRASEVSFYREAFGIPDRIAVRDSVAQSVVRSLGYNTDLIPCPAIASGIVFEKATAQDFGPRKHVLINFQARGANTDWGQGVDENSWFQTMRKVISVVEKNEHVVMLAHNQAEQSLARRLAPHLPAVFPKTPGSYASTILNAKAGIVSRVHAGVALAGVGIPSLTVGTDTRIGTMETLGLPTRYVKDADADWLVGELSGLLSESDSWRERLNALRTSAVEDYAKILRSLASS